MHAALQEDIVTGAAHSLGITDITSSNKDRLVKLLSLREVIFNVKSSIDQFVEGLDEVHTFIFSV